MTDCTIRGFDCRRRDLMNAEEKTASEPVVRQSYRRIIMVVVFGLIALAALMLMSSEPAEAYTVTGTETWVADTYLMEDLVIAPGGVLNVQNSNIFMEPTFDGQWMILVMNGGTLNTVNADITHDNLFPFTYNFIVDQGATASFVNTRVSYAGGPNIYEAMIILSGDVVMNQLVVTNSRYSGILYANDTMGFTATNCYFGNNADIGVEIWDMGAADYYFTFNGGTIFENNMDYGIYVDGMSNKNFGLTLQDTAVRGSFMGIWMNQQSGGTATLDFQTADFSGNIISNVWVDGMNNADLRISAVNSNFAGTQAFGIYIGTLTGAAGSNLTVWMDTSFVTWNAGSGLYVNQITNGWMDFDIIDSGFDNNAADGVYVPLTAPNNVLLFDALRTSFSGNSNSGLLISGANPGSIFITVDDCDFFSNSRYGLEVGRVVNGDLSLIVLNSHFEFNGGTEGAITSYGIYNGDAWILIGDNEFNNSYSGMYFADSLDGAWGGGHMITFTFSGNWHDSDMGLAGVYFGRDVLWFDETTITINNNHFYGREVKGYGVYFAGGVYGDFGYWQNLTMDVSGNEFLLLDESAFWSNGGFYGFRNVGISINGNLLMDTDWDYNYGFILMDVHGDTNYDTSLSLVINNNVFMNLTEYVVYTPVFNFRHVNMDISSNVVYGNGGATIFGFTIDGLMYGSTNEPSDLVFNANNNEFYDLLWYGFYISTWWASFYSDADMSFTNNHFNGSAFGTFSTGIYIEGDIFYNWNMISSLNILMDNNEFIDLEAMGVYFNGAIYDFSDMNLAFTNNLFENRYQFTMDRGVFTWGIFHTYMGLPTSLVLTFDGNQFYDLNNDGFYVDEPIWGIRNVTLNIDRNVVENRMGVYMDYGFYFPGGIVYDSNDNDNFLHISITENVIRDVSEVGIYFGNWVMTYGFRHVDIQIHDNVLENLMDINNMNFGIEWYYEIVYTTSSYDSSFVIDITGNVIRDLSWDGIAFRYNAGWEFGMFTNVSVNIQDNVFTNQFSGGTDYGIYLRPFWSGRTDVDNFLDVTIVNNTFDSLTVAGIHFAAYVGFEFEDYRTVNFVISQNVFTNTAGHWMDAGIVMQSFIYWDDSYASSLYLEISDNTFMDLTADGVQIGGTTLGYSQVSINTFDNYFSDAYNDFDCGIRFEGNIHYTFINDGSFQLTSLRNEFYDLMTYGIYIAYDVYDFRNATILVQDSVFANTINNWMDHGVYLSSLYYSDTVWDNYLLVDITNNRFENLSQYGFTMSWITGYRHVTIDIVSNHFSDIYNSFDYGVYLRSEISYDVNFDGSFIANVVGNTFMDLSSGGVYFASDVHSFRSVWINVDNNDFVCYLSNWMDNGVRFNAVYYNGADDQDSAFLLDVVNNDYQNLTATGFEISWIYFRHVTINVVNNQYSDTYGSFDYGFYENEQVSYTTSYDSDITINIMDNTVYDLVYMGFGFGEISYFRNVMITIDNNDFICTISNWLDYGVYIDEVYYGNSLHDNSLQLMVTNNNFENLTQIGFVTWGIYDYRHVTIDVLNNYFSEIYNSFDYGWYISGVYFGTSAVDSDFTFTMTGNEFRNLYQWGGGAYLGDVWNYYTTVANVDSNDFISTQPSRLYAGLYIGYLAFGDESFDAHLWLNLTNNNFENLYELGFANYETYGFRHVFWNFLDNSFSDQYNQFWVGIYIGEDSVYYDTSYDSELHVNILRNTFQDLSYTGVYFDCNIWDFRNIWITIDNNDFMNTMNNWMDYGVRFQNIYYNANSHNTNLFLDVNNNTFQNLAYAGIYINQIYNYRNVGIDIHYNVFSDIYDDFDYGFFVSSEIYYTTSFPGVFDLMVNNNNFNDLTSHSVHFNQIRNFLDTDMVVIDNDFSDSDYGFYVSNGVDYADDWYLLFTRNNGNYMDGRILYVGSTSYGTYGVSRALLHIHNNTIGNSWSGFYIGNIGYYDTAEILVDDNVLLNMYNGYGIYLDWVYEGSSAYISIQRNTVTGNMENAIRFDGSEDMPLLMDIAYNDIDGVQTAIYMEEPAYGDDMLNVATINIMQNNILNIQEYGIYIDYLYWGLLDLNIQNNQIMGDPVAYYGVSFFHLDYADWGSIADIDFIDNTMQNGFYGIYFDYQGSGSMITLDLYNTNITNTYYTLYFQDPISSNSDVFSVKLRKSTFTTAQLSFFYLNDPGYGLFVVDITDCHVIDYGSLGGYGFYMAQNDGGYVRMDIHSTQFVGSSSRLGDAFAGSGQVLINFWYITGITSGVSNGWNQRIQVLWDVDVQVYIGSDYTTTAGPGIVVYVEDQFGYMSFYTTTNGAGAVPDQTVAGVLITYTGTPFSGQAVHTFWATQGTFSGSAIGTFSANGSISILLPGDSDGDGLHDGIDIDDDNDGVPDIYDAFPYDPNESKDTDGDGEGDNADTDDDGDGVPDTSDAFPTNPWEWSDTDGDGVGDNTDIDIDGDGIPNIVDTSPYNNTGFQDSDGDGAADAVDKFPYNPNEWSDNDNDGIGNNADSDDDNDGVPDTVDLYPFDPTRTDTRSDRETTINVDLDKAPDWTAPLAIIIIGAILVLLMWLLFGRRRAEEEEEPLPAPKEEEVTSEDEVISKELDEILGERSEEEEGLDTY